MCHANPRTRLQHNRISLLLSGYLCLYFKCFPFIRFVLYVSLNDCCMQIGSCYLDTPIGDVHQFTFNQPHITVNSRTCIPTAILLLRIINSDRHRILSRFHIRCNIYKKRRIAIRMPTCTLPVDIDLRVHIDSFEIKLVFPALNSLG